jgi:hypothetical protein
MATRAVPDTTTQTTRASSSADDANTNADSKYDPDVPHSEWSAADDLSTATSVSRSSSPGSLAAADMTRYQPESSSTLADADEDGSSSTMPSSPISGVGLDSMQPDQKFERIERDIDSTLRGQRWYCHVLLFGNCVLWTKVFPHMF